MINFVVCEDNKIILQRNIDIINRVMFKNNINYRVYPFSNYNDDLKKLIKSDIGKKIYILDIELEDVSGIDIAINIRETDLKSSKKLKLTVFPKTKGTILVEVLRTYQFDQIRLFVNCSGLMKS